MSAAKSYDPGTAKPAVRMADGRWSIDSFKDEGISYVVSADLAHCSCPHHTKRAVECKHLQAVKAQRAFALAAERSRKLSDEQIEFWLRAYTLNGDAVVAGAIRCERHRRQQQQQRDQELKAVFA